jgi:hypothetical protein
MLLVPSGCNPEQPLPLVVHSWDTCPTPLGLIQFMASPPDAVNGTSGTPTAIAVADNFSLPIVPESGVTAQLAGSLASLAVAAR